MGLEDSVEVLKYLLVGLPLAGLVLARWNWPGSRRSDMPPGKNFRQVAASMTIAIVHARI